MTAPCPICAGPGQVQRRLTADEITAGFYAVFAEKPPAGAVPGDYDIAGCTVCGLVFADPMAAGDAALYGWLTGFTKYHAQDRWEWTRMKAILAAAGRPMALLELGAGRGDFLAEIATVPDLDVAGIELSAASARAARARGLDVRQAALEDIVAGEAGAWDVVVLSHVLEHVAAPLALMADVKRLLKPGGRVLFSLPYSPMSREYLHDDIMNLPPHHMTRWNISALETLARVTGMRLETWMPRAKRPWKRALKHTCDLVRGEGRVSGLARLPVVLANWRTFRKVLADHRKRDRVDGRMAADTVLVSLALPDAAGAAPEQRAT